MKKRKVMVVGSGAREHAISNAYEQSDDVGTIIVAPGNDFMTYKRDKEVILEKNTKLTDPNSFLEVAKKHKPDLVDVAQDDALAAGTVDLLQKEGFRVFGPTKDSSRIEWDKAWSREFMDKYVIPSPEFKAFNSTNDANKYVDKLYDEDKERILYIKAAGLCAGKGALRAESLKEAKQRISEMGNFGKAGEHFVIEEGLVGEEFSYYAICDGLSFYPFRSAQDNKLSHNFDTGEQTGGMGVISPAMVTEGLEKRIQDKFMAPVMFGMIAENHPYVGMLYFGGINTDKGISTIEYNARWGDPECQLVLPGLVTDYFYTINNCIERNLRHIDLVEDEEVRVCVVGAAKGYPGDYSEVKGKEIFGLDDAMEVDDVKVYGAAVAMEDGKFYANGGRLFSIVAEGYNIIDAKYKAYEAMSMIHIDGNNLHYRTDIGWRDVERFWKEI